MSRTIFFRNTSPATLSAALLAATILTAGGAAPGASAATPSARSAPAVRLHSDGAVNLRALAAKAARNPAPQSSKLASPARAEYRSIPLRTFRPAGSRAGAAPGAPHATAPSSFASGGLGSGFNGLDHYDQRILADSGNQFSLEPPDQALAVGGGYILEAVNNALMVYDTDGNRLLPAPVSMNRFMNQESEINRTNNQLGPFLSDPRAFYDAATGRFFVSEWGTLNDASGNPLGISVQWLAVSQTGDPTGAWAIYDYETTNSDVPGCPCLPDFNQLGADANGVFITSNLFQLGGFGGFVGTKIYALPKAGLESGGGTYYVSFPVMPNDFTVHPTVIPPHGKYATENGGAEYFVEGTADLSQTGVASNLIVYAATGTSSLNGFSPSLTLTGVTVPSESVSANMVPAVQKDGSRPLGNSLGDPAPLLDAGDARIGSTPVYLNTTGSGPGTIWAVSGTAVTPTKGPTRDGVAWFQIRTTPTSKAFTAKIKTQGIIAGPAATDLIYPAIAVNTAGDGGIGVTVTGPGLYPSTAYIPMPEFANAKIHLLGAGALPDDGFTAYPQYGGGGVGRWGDYGAATIDEYGDLWLAGEYIPDTSKHPRSSLANWGTYLTRVPE